MSVSFGGPGFMPAADVNRKSIYGKDGAHYNIYATRDPDQSLAYLREWFGKADSVNEMNFVLFSTSGVHGSYTTIEEIETDIREFGAKGCGLKDCEHDYHGREITFLIIQPRIVGMTYGNAACQSLDDVTFLKDLRSRSWAAVQLIGAVS